MSGRTALHLRIHGRVQGVGYRYWTCRQAEALGLTGWVRNRRDGTVEALISGPEEAVRDMAARCGEGPASAVVERVDREEVPPLPGAGFKSLPTE